MQIFLILVILLGGTSVAAERAVPGDVLYPVKIDINENVADFFAVSPTADANWNVHAAERRLEEAETLAAKGTLTADVKAQLEENFKRHADKVDARIAKFEADSDFKASADVAANFEVSLKVHEDILARLAAKGSADMLGSLQATVSQEAAKNESKQNDMESSSGTSSSAQVNTSAKVDSGAIDANGSAGVKIDIGGSSSEKTTGGTCPPPAPSSFGKQACCDTKTGQWFLSTGTCTNGGSI